MRIIRGEFKGRKLTCPRGRSVRPTRDRVRESLFQILESRYGVDWPDVMVIDLFAGSGILGIEALSRGAEHAVFIEKDRKVVSILKKNIETCGVDSRTALVKNDVFKVIRDSAMPQHGNKRMVVFADPPYGTGMSLRLLEAASETGAFPGEGDLIVLEESSRTRLPENFNGTGARVNLQEKRFYGDTALSFYLVGRPEDEEQLCPE